MLGIRGYRVRMQVSDEKDPINIKLQKRRMKLERPPGFNVPSRAIVVKMKNRQRKNMRA